MLLENRPQKSRTMDSTCATSIALNNATTSFQYTYGPNDDGTFLIVIGTCIIFVGFIGNKAFIGTVIRVPSLYTSTLTSLACTDLFTLTGFVGLAVHEILPFRSKNIFLLQAMSEMVAWFSFIWSLCLVTLTSMERYLAICRPIKHHLLKGTRRTFKMIAVTFLFTLVILETLRFLCLNERNISLVAICAVI